MCHIAFTYGHHPLHTHTHTHTHTCTHIHIHTHTHTHTHTHLHTHTYTCTHTHLRTQLPFPRKRDVLNYLMTIPVHTDDELQLASMEIEPPENSGEKKRYQELK